MWPRNRGRGRFGAPVQIAEVAARGCGLRLRGEPAPMAGVGAWVRVHGAEVPSALSGVSAERGNRPNLALVAVADPLLAPEPPLAAHPAICSGACVNVPYLHALMEGTLAVLHGRSAPVGQDLRRKSVRIGVPDVHPALILPNRPSTLKVSPPAATMPLACRAKRIRSHRFTGTAPRLGAADDGLYRTRRAE